MTPEKRPLFDNDFAVLEKNGWYLVFFSDSHPVEADLMEKFAEAKQNLQIIDHIASDNYTHRESGVVLFISQDAGKLIEYGGTVQVGNYQGESIQGTAETIEEAMTALHEWLLCVGEKKVSFDRMRCPFDTRK